MPSRDAILIPPHFARRLSEGSEECPQYVSADDIACSLPDDIHEISATLADNRSSAAVLPAVQREASGAVGRTVRDPVPLGQHETALPSPGFPHPNASRPSLMAQDREPRFCQEWTPEEDGFILERNLDRVDDHQLLVLSELLPGRGMEDIKRRSIFLSSVRLDSSARRNDGEHLLPDEANQADQELRWRLIGSGDDGVDTTSRVGHARPGRRNLGVDLGLTERRQQKRRGGSPVRTIASGPDLVRAELTGTAPRATSKVSTGVEPLRVEPFADAWWERVRAADVPDSETQVSVFAGKWMNAFGYARLASARGR